VPCERETCSLMKNQITLFISFVIMMITIIAIGLLVYFIGKKRNLPKYLISFAILCVAMGTSALFDLIFQVESRVSDLSILSAATIGFIIIRFARKISMTLCKVMCGLCIFAWIASWVTDAMQSIYALQHPIIELMEPLKIGMILALGLNVSAEDVPLQSASQETTKDGQ